MVKARQWLQPVQMSQQIERIQGKSKSGTEAAIAGTSCLLAIT